MAGFTKEWDSPWIFRCDYSMTRYFIGLSKGQLYHSVGKEVIHVLCSNCVKYRSSSILCTVWTIHFTIGIYAYGLCLICTLAFLLILDTVADTIFSSNQQPIRVNAHCRPRSSSGGGGCLKRYCTVYSHVLHLIGILHRYVLYIKVLVCKA